MSGSSARRRQRVGIVGGGRAGLSLAIALAVDGAQEIEVRLWIRDPERAAAAIAWLEAAGLAGVAVDSPIAGDADSSGRLAGSVDVWRGLDVLVFAVPDRAIEPAVASAAAAGWLGPELCLLHLSGAAPVDALTGAGHRCVAAMHPLAALRDPLLVAPSAAAVAEVLQTLCGATFGLAGASDALAIATSWLDRWHAPRVLLAPDARVLWHAAAALVANDLVALLALGEGLAQDAGVDPVLARPAQLHLARSALDAVRAETADGAPIWHGLTGAVRRGDAETLARHVTAMEAVGAHEAAREHRALSQVLVALLARHHALPADRLAALRAVLAAPAGPGPTLAVGDGPIGDGPVDPG